MLSTLCMLAVCNFASCTPAQLGSAYLARKIDAPPARYIVHIERHVAIRTSDGTALVADIFHPIGPPKSPTIRVRIPYSKTLYNQLAATLIGTLWAERLYRSDPGNARTLRIGRRLLSAMVRMRRWHRHAALAQASAVVQRATRDVGWIVF